MGLSVNETNRNGVIARNETMKHPPCQYFVNSSVLTDYLKSLETAVLGVFTNAKCKTFSFDELRKYVNRARRYGYL